MVGEKADVVQKKKKPKAGRSFDWGYELVVFVSKVYTLPTRSHGNGLGRCNKPRAVLEIRLSGLWSFGL